METNELDILDVSQFMLDGTFDEQVRLLLSIIRMTKSEVENLTKLFNDIERALCTMWPNCRIMPFGSVISGLGIKTSDVDIYAQVPKRLYETEQTCVSKARKIFRLRSQFQQILAIPKAKVPIIKFYHVPTGRNCDINFKSPSGVQNSNLIAYLLQMDPRALPLTILIKYWSKVHSLTGTNLMPSYCLIMMVIFFLQQNNILPSVYKLQNEIEAVMVEGWNTAFNYCYRHETRNSKSLYTLLGDFFVYYSTFDYTNVISPFAGYTLPKKSFHNKQAHDIFWLYKDYLNITNSKELKTDSHFCVQDPFEHNRNCAVAVFPRLAHSIISHFKSAAHAFSNVQEADFLKSIFTVLSETHNNARPNSLSKKKLNKSKSVNKINHQFKNKMLKHKPNYYNIRKDKVKNDYNAHLKPHTNYLNR